MILRVSDIAGRFGFRPKEVERFLKFAIVGTVGFFVDFGTLTFLIEVFGLPTLVANTFSFSAAVVSNFVLNRYWTFPDSRTKTITSQLSQFVLINVLGLGLNSIILFLLESPFNQLIDTLDLATLAGRGYWPAKMIATIVVLFWNFFANRYWTYGDVE